MRKFLLVLLLCVTYALSQGSFENISLQVAQKIYDDCSKAGTFSYCLKKKAITFLDRLSRMDKLSVTDGIIIRRVTKVPNDDKHIITEEQVDNVLLRSTADRDIVLNSMLLNKTAKFIGSRTLEIVVPDLLHQGGDLEEGRKGGGGSGGGGGKGGMKGMMGGLMMGVAAKMAAMIPVAIAGLFLLAGKALITAKIALLLSGIIAIKKLFASKHGGGGSAQGHGWQSSGGGGGGGWQSSGGWDKRSINAIAHKDNTIA